MGRGSGMGGLLAVLGLVLIMSGGVGASPKLPDFTSHQEDDPLAPEDTGSTFISKKTGVISPGMYTQPVVRRSGALKPVSKIFEVAKRSGSFVYMK